ncbi:MAG: type II secretion system protein [Rubrivivax sp.]|nr:type II secretion system protein [Rubrivivax sp.]
MNDAQRLHARGFTLVELIAALAIMAVLATVVVPTVQVQVQREKERELRAALREIRNAIDAYKLAGDQGRIAREAGSTGYPKTLEILVSGVEDRRDPKRGKIRFLRRVPRNVLHDDPRTPDSETWAFRSYASEADAPEPGDDIYDVYAPSRQLGLNGAPYYRW